MACVLFWPRGPAEPVYQGRKLSEWLEDSFQGQEAETRRAAEQAVQRMGTNALPWLMSEFSRRDPKWKAATRRWLAKQSWTNGRIRTEEYRIWLAANGLYILRPATALPELSGYLGDEQRGDAVAQVLSATKEPAIPYLLRAIDSTNTQAGVNAMSSLGLMAEHTEAAIPLLVQALRA